MFLDVIADVHVLVTEVLIVRCTHVAVARDAGVAGENIVDCAFDCVTPCQVEILADLMQQKIIVTCELADFHLVGESIEGRGCAG